MTSPRKGEDMEIKIRPAVSSDSAACGKLIAKALAALSQRQGLPAEFDESSASALTARMLDHPEMYGLVAEAEGQMAGTVFLDERAVVRGIGWLAVEPSFQGRHIGRLMLNEVIERSLTSPGMRTVVGAESSNAIGLLTSLRFEVKEPVALIRGRLKDAPPAAVRVRAMTNEDIEPCGALTEQAHGFARASELRNAIESGAALVALRDGGIAGYATDLCTWHAGHAVALTEEDLKALVIGAAAKWNELAFLIPTRQANLFRWCLGQGLRVERPMLLMSLGEYQEPACPWLPSLMF
jgi:predicted N-acetyltransferase YhbS